MNRQTGLLSPAPWVRPIPARGIALGDRTNTDKALKGRPIAASCQSGTYCVWTAPSGLGSLKTARPGALPRADMGCPFGAQKPSASRVDAHLRNMAFAAVGQ